MNVRVNLLKPDEYRRQGAVSNAFIVRMSVFSVLAFTTLFAAIFVARMQVAHRDLRAAREIWRMREPIYAQVQSMKQDLALMKKLSQELKGWSVSRVEWVPMLEELGRLVPPIVQLRRLQLRADSDIRITGPVPVVGGVGDVQPGGAKPAASAGMPGRTYFLSLDGKASGDMADAVVVQFVRALGRAEQISPILESIKLSSLQREASIGGAIPDRRFTIEAATIRFELRESREK